jgi:hypothetical protein
MRTRELLRATLPAFAIFTLAAGELLPAVGAMPPGWEELPAERLLETVEATIQADGEEFAEREQVAADVWRRFLQDPAFVTSGDWDVVHSLANLFGGADVAVGGATTAELRGDLVSRLNGRLQSDEEVLSGRNIYTLGAETQQLQKLGATTNDTADAFAAWMDHNEWREFDLASLYNLYSWVSADAVDRRHFSARWTGFIAAPRTGEYTLRQIQQYSGTNSQLLVTVDGQVVLDSRDKAQGPERFESRAIMLTGGQPTPIVVAMRHDVSRIDYSEGAPMVVITWESSGVAEAIVPSSAYSLPEGFSEVADSGLNGEYFADTDFRDLKVTRIDPALDLASSWPPMAPIHHSKSAAVLNACVEKLLHASFLEGAAEAGNDEVFSYHLWRVAYRMSATQRDRLVETLLASPRVQESMTAEAMGRLYQAIYFLPGNRQVELLGEWALANEQPQIVVADFPGWGPTHYQALNTDYYWLMGLFMQGPYQEQLKVLWDDYLVRPNGECNLHVAYATSAAARKVEWMRDFRKRLLEQADNPELSGDARSTWLLALAFAAEFENANPWPANGVEYAREAVEAAETEGYRFRALQDLVARHAACGESEAADESLEKYGSLVNDPSLRTKIASWRPRIAEMAEAYAERGADRELADIANYRQIIQRRRDRAVESGNSAASERYRQQLIELENVLKN